MDPAGWIDSTLDLVARHHDGLGPVVLFFSSLIEYVFPPFPGDVITLFGTYLVVQGLWSFGFALTLTTAGSLVGAGLDYAIGVWLARRSDRLPTEANRGRFSPLTREKFELLSERFRKYGVIYIAINRFLPGIRAFFFVAAGASGLSLVWTMVFAALSALVFNSIILGVGYSVGSNWERLRELFASYTTGVWILIGLALLLVVVMWLWRRRQAKKGA